MLNIFSILPLWSVQRRLNFRTPANIQVVKLLQDCAQNIKTVNASTIKLPFVISAKMSDSFCLPQNGEVDPAVKALEARQDEIMRKLYELKAAVEGLAKTVTTPDADLDLTVGSSLSSQSPTSTTFRGVTDLDTLLGKVGIWASHSWALCIQETGQCLFVMSLLYYNDILHVLTEPEFLATDILWLSLWQHSIDVFLITPIICR